MDNDVDYFFDRKFAEIFQWLDKQDVEKQPLYKIWPKIECLVTLK